MTIVSNRIAGFMVLLTTTWTGTSRLAFGQDPQSPVASDSRDRLYYPGDVEGPKPLVRKLAGNILLDQKAIWLSPFHINRESAPWWIGFGAVTAALIATDNRSSGALENSSGQIRWGNDVSRIGAGYTLAGVAGGFYGLGILFHNEKARETGVLGGEAMLDSLIVVSVLKPIAGRNRPDAGKEAGHFFEGGSSFPSGHAISTWALASVVAHEYHDTKVVPIIAYGLASVVSAARFSARQHYLADIVAGGGMGWFIGRYVYQTHEAHSGHRHGFLNPQIMPIFEPSDRTYGVGLVFGN